MKKTMFLIALLAAGIMPAAGQEAFNYDSLSMLRLLEYGLQANFDIRIKRQIVGESQGQKQSMKGAFNPSLTLTGYGYYGTDPTVTFLNSYYLNGQFLLPTRFGAKFYTGFKLSTMTQIISGVPDFYPSTNMAINASGMWAGVNMPLLRDFGRYNTNNVNYQTSIIMNQAQDVAFSDEVCVFIRNTLNSYYAVYQRLKIYKILGDAEKDAQEYLRDIGYMIDAEQIPKSEIYRAKAYESNINQQFAESKNMIHNSLYDLVTSLAGKATLKHRGYPVILDSLPDPAEFPWGPYAAYVFKNTDTLVAKTHYLKSQELATTASMIQMKAARYNKRNELDLDLRYYYFGTTAYQPFSDFSQTFSSGSPGSSVNLTLSYKLPFSNDQQKGDYVSKLSAYELNKTQLEKVRFDAKMQVYQLLSDLGNLISLYKKQIELVSLEKKTFENEAQKFKMGNSTQINVINTYMDYNTSLLNQENGRQAILSKVILLKYLIGEFPTTPELLLKYNPWDFSVK
ncbi:MAG: TolC family protein [Bacteroidota bacterium]